MLFIDFAKDADSRNHAVAIHLEQVTHVHEMQSLPSKQDFRGSREVVKDADKEPVLHVFFAGGQRCMLHGWTIDRWRKMVSDVMKSTDSKKGIISQFL